MAKTKTVEHGTCYITGKRAFWSEDDAEKALGRAQARRGRQRAGGDRESRYYLCGACDGYHLTHLSRRQVAQRGMVLA